MLKQSITKEFSFSAAHHLGNGYEGKCKNQHGHNYKLFVTVSLRQDVQVSKVGFVEDFGLVKAFWKELEPKYDHQDLNISLGIQTSAENISMLLFKEFSERINNDRVEVTHIKLYETDTSYAEVTYES
jgi:6-pyruvoyltetrahydropterin/6-carboxytetrahydropterin synthase